MGILRNAAKCLKCGDVIESVHRHDFRRCSCKALAVDGGKAYVRRLFTAGVPYEDLSEHTPEDNDPEPEQVHA